MSAFPPNGHRHFRDVRDKMGPKAMLAELVAGELVAVIWNIRDGEGRDVSGKHWLSTAADYTMRNAAFYTKYPNQEKLLVRELVPRTAPEAQPPKNRGGHPGKWDWEGALVEAAVYIVAFGVPNKTDLKKHLLEWFARQSDDGSTPDEGDVRKRVNRICGAVQQELAIKDN
jgi:hypothetical protein